MSNHPLSIQTNAEPEDHSPSATPNDTFNPLSQPHQNKFARAVANNDGVVVSAETSSGVQQSSTADHGPFEAIRDPQYGQSLNIREAMPDRIDTVPGIGEMRLEQAINANFVLQEEIDGAASYS